MSKIVLSGKYTAYPEYKESGVEWFGLVPSAWVSSKLKFESSINMGQSPNSVDCNQNGLGLPFLQGNAEFGIKSPSPKQYCDVSRKVAQKGNLLFSVRAPVGALNLADQTYGIGRGLCAISNNESLTPDFLWWLIPVVRSELDSVSTGSTFEAVSAEQVENVVICKPSIDEQEKIANFLDHETAKIDILIEKQQQLIKLLKEKRQAVISHAVTKGISNKEQPNAPMRDSGVEWLGEVPEHWPMPKISQLGRVLNGSTPDKTNLSYWEGGTIPWLASGCLNSEIVNEPSLLISEGAYQNSSVELIPANSLLVGMVGQGKTRGTSAILAIDSCINQNMAAIIPGKKVQVRFLYFLFQAMYEDLRELGRGGNQAALNCEIIGSIRVPLPPKDEQTAIVDMLDELLIKINNADILGAEQIELLKERRTALISAAVTGKIDVRNWVMPTPTSISTNGASND